MSPPTIVPYFGYLDGNKAIAFLTEAFGFKENQVYRDENGAVMHAELSFGNGIIMMGTGKDEQRDESKLNIAPTRGIYLVVDDVDAHCEKARHAGAQIVWEPHDTKFGTRRYRAMDIEGYEWSFGTYQPALAEK